MIGRGRDLHGRLCRGLQRAAIVLSLALCLAPAAAEEAHPLTAQDVGGFLDALVPPALEHGSIPGAVVVVVKDGAVLAERGYGYANVAAKTKPDPDRTLFRPGSISKTFTWTAVMQLVEAGKIDLDRDINTYLDFHVPDAWPQPITMRNLMTHTAGFEDRVEDIVYWDPQAAPSNERYLKSWIPTRIYPPGTIIAYSNYGAALAGYIVQRVSGEDYDEYVRRHIFEPLGMAHSSFRQPLPAAAAPDLAAGYLPGSATAQRFEMIAPAPAGGLSTTGTDMARFMIAHLHYGRFGDERILQEATARAMDAPAFQPSPGVNGMALGFRREDRNGQAIIAHAGGTILFQSDMHLFLDQDVGLFISMNSTGTGGEADKLRRALLEQFTDRYFPQALPDQPTLATALDHGRLAAGFYQVTQRSEGNLGAFIGMLNQAQLTVDADGIVTIGTLADAEGKPRRWREVAPFVWRALDSEGSLAMQVTDGRVATILAPPLYVFQPVPWWRSAGWNGKLLLATIAILAVSALAWPAAALLRLVFRREQHLHGAGLRRYRLIGAACAVNLIFLTGIPILLTVASSSGNWSLTDEIDFWLRLIQLCGVLGAVGTVVAICDAGLGRGAGSTWWRRLWSGAIAGAGVAVLWFAVTFHLLSWDLNF
jgi:CubicO group peptidase (beta-lactamase class C family)